LISELTISATLYVNFPFVGRIDIAKIEGDLRAGFTIDSTQVLATGSASFSSAKHDLYIDLSQRIKYFGKLSTNGNLKLISFPF